MRRSAWPIDCTEGIVSGRDRRDPSLLFALSIGRLYQTAWKLGTDVLEYSVDSGIMI